MLQALFLQPITFACFFTLSRLSLVSFMHAGNPPLPDNYLTDGFLQLRVQLLDSSHDFCSFLLDASLPSCTALLQPAPGILLI